MSRLRPSLPFAALARLCGVQTAYYDVTHKRRQASPEALHLALKALGVPVETRKEASTALRDRRQAPWKRLAEPVVVAWRPGSAHVEVRLPQSQAEASLDCHLKMERGEVRSWRADLSSLPAAGTAEVEGARYVSKLLPLPGPLPWGYHTLTLEAPRGQAESMVIAAPRGAYIPGERKSWGIFLPLYALHSQRSWGAGDLTDLEALLEWEAEFGGEIAATLPLLPTFLDDPCDPSPYTPASRLFWSEFYLDVTRIPEFARSQEAQSLLRSAEAGREMERLRAAPLVDYRGAMGLKRRVLEELAKRFFQEPSGERQAALERFAGDSPLVEDYARFRATMEHQQAPWPRWPLPARNGDLRSGDYTDDAYRYHLYVQWQAHQQMEEVASAARRRGQRLYLDLPLGVHPDGYDVWREQALFAQGVSAGAPPDSFFIKGQDWGFPPLHPERSREQHHRYFIACLRHHLRHAGLLRIDHVMGLHRLFWVPQGMEAREGVYVQYPAEELYAILSVESHRHQAIIVGENLGTVPAYVDRSLAQHRLQRMDVAQYKATPDTNQLLVPGPADIVASLNTHDMPTFVAFWQRLDIEDRLALGLLTESEVKGERERREAFKEALLGGLRRQGLLAGHVTPERVLRACLDRLSASTARVMLIALEDLWQETQPQNVPGTTTERPNWRRKARHGFETFSRMPSVIQTLKDVASFRS
ncbi:MAG: 4-alpha-glucanotransferase [Chloroflexi bacterium]|nr:4-alpha-glucanotransferase [Chloroflexota bacterium]